MSHFNWPLRTEAYGNRSITAAKIAPGAIGTINITPGLDNQIFQTIAGAAAWVTNVTLGGTLTVPGATQVPTLTATGAGASPGGALVVQSLGATITGGLTVPSGGMAVTGGVSVVNGGLNVLAGAVTFPGGNSFGTASGGNSATIGTFTNGGGNFSVGLDNSTGTIFGAGNFGGVISSPTSFTLRVNATVSPIAAMVVNTGGVIAFPVGSVSLGSPTASTGTFRLPQLASIAFRNNGNSGDILALRVTATDNIDIGGGGANVAQITFGTASGSARLGGGIVVGSGVLGGSAGDMGGGTINVGVNVFKNGAVYNNPDFLFELAESGKVVSHINEAWGHYQRTMGPRVWPIEEMEGYVREHHHFPLIEDRPAGVFTDAQALGRDDTALTLLEQAHLYIFELHHRIAKLEAAHA